jgi:ABC-type multidrug transport system ATPase subunit
MNDTSPPEIRTEGLSRRFGSHWAVRDAAIRAPAGMVTGFVGPNGAGKTTTLRMLLGLIRPTSGTAHIGDHVVRGGPDTIPVRVRALVERASFYESLTAFENLSLLANLTARVPPAEVDGLLERLGLSYVRDRKVSGFSTGMLQRLALALCLLGDPRVVVLDEPTSGLDPEFRVTVRELVHELRRNGRTTVLLSSHLLYELQEMVDHVVLIRDGRVVKQGLVRELLTGEGTAARFRFRGTPLEKLAAALADFKPMTQDGEVAVVVDREKVPELVAAVVAAGVRLYELREERTSLEDLYISTVAREKEGGA